MTFRIRGVECTKNTDLPTIIRQIIQFLDKQKDGDLFPTRDLATSLHYSLGYIGNFSADPALTGYRELNMQKDTQTGRSYPVVFWGNPKTISAFKRWKKNGKDNAE